MRHVPRSARVLAAAALVAAAITPIASCQLHNIGAGALLYPSKRAVNVPAPDGCTKQMWSGEGVRLAGWRCVPPNRPSSGTIVYLHGVADNRTSSIGVIRRFLPRGFEVVAYDSRAHGESDGRHCTYGYYEKRDLVRVLDQLGAQSAIVIGGSLGAAVALQAAAIDRRITAVVAASTFSDLRTIATERAPFVFTASTIAGAFARAETDGQFIVDEASPVRSAAAITAPVFLIHGETDRETTAAHSRRVYGELRGPKKLLIVPSAGHNDVLTDDVWRQIEAWLSSALASRATASRTI